MASDKAVLRLIMYGFIAAAVSMIIYQNASSDWIRVHTQNIYENYNTTMSLGLWSICTTTRSCPTDYTPNDYQYTDYAYDNDVDSVCTSSHSCIYANEDLLDVYVDSYTFYYGARTFSVITMILMVAAIICSICLEFASEESNAGRGPLGVWIAATVTAALSNFGYLFFGIGVSAPDQPLTVSSVKFRSAFIVSWFSMAAMFVLIFLAYANFKDKIRPFRRVPYARATLIDVNAPCVSQSTAGVNPPAYPGNMPPAPRPSATVVQSVSHAQPYGYGYGCHAAQSSVDVVRAPGVTVVNSNTSF